MHKCVCTLALHTVSSTLYPRLYSQDGLVPPMLSSSGTLPHVPSSPCQPSRVLLCSVDCALLPACPIHLVAPTIVSASTTSLLL